MSTTRAYEPAIGTEAPKNGIDRNPTNQAIQKPRFGSPPSHDTYGRVQRRSPKETWNGKLLKIDQHFCSEAGPFCL